METRLSPAQVRVKALWDTADKGARIILLLFLGWSEDQAVYWSKIEWKNLKEEFTGNLVRDNVAIHDLSKR